MEKPNLSVATVGSQDKFVRGAQINARGSVDGVAVYVNGQHGKTAIYFTADQAAGFCFKLHGAVQESHRANGRGGMNNAFVMSPWKCSQRKPGCAPSRVVSV